METFLRINTKIAIINKRELSLILIFFLLRIFFLWQFTQAKSYNPLITYTKFIKLATLCRISLGIKRFDFNYNSSGYQNKYFLQTKKQI